MKTKEEIEQLALLKYPKFSSDPYNPGQDDDYYERLIWIEGYTQCQEDMSKKTWTFEEILDASYPTLGRGGDWAEIAIRLKEQKL